MCFNLKMTFVLGTSNTLLSLKERRGVIQKIRGLRGRGGFARRNIYSAIKSTKKGKRREGKRTEKTRRAHKIK